MMNVDSKVKRAQTGTGMAVTRIALDIVESSEK
jgi:hypothetical protein